MPGAGGRVGGDGGTLAQADQRTAKPRRNEGQMRRMEDSVEQGLQERNVRPRGP